MAEVTVESLLKRANLFLEDKEFARADEYAERALDINPECAEAYLIKLCCDFKVTTRAALDNLKEPFTDNNNYKKILRFGSSALKKELKGYVTKAEENKKNECEKQLAEEKSLEAIRKKYLPASRMISIGEKHIVCLKSDGTVVALGNNDYGQCNVSEWRDIVAVSAGRLHTVGLKADGTVVAVGFNKLKQCNVSNWTNVHSIAAGDCQTAGIIINGNQVLTVAVGEGGKGQLGVDYWCYRVALALGKEHTVGIDYQGFILVTGSNEYGQCNVKGWRDLAAIAAGEYHTVGVKKDGTVVAVGKNDYGQCNVSNWRDIIAVSAGNYHTVGLKADGTVVCTGIIFGAQADVRNWTNIVAISAGQHGNTLGLKADGTVVVADMNNVGQRYVSDWKLFDSVDTIEQERAKKTAELKRIDDEKRKAAEEEEKRIEEEKRRETEKRIIIYLQQKSALQTELANLRGLFKGKRKNQIKARLEYIEKQLTKLQKSVGAAENSSTANSTTAKR